MENPIVMLIDFSRAFDSIQHEYLFEVLAFFKFGEGIIGMIKQIKKLKN